MKVLQGLGALSGIAPEVPSDDADVLKDEAEIEETAATNTRAYKRMSSF